jgi:2-phosphoglycerate kinase
MAESNQKPGSVEETVEHIRELNDRILEAAEKTGGAYLDAYEQALQSIADYQEQVAKQTDVEWVSTIVDAQARFTREMTKILVSTGRDLLK